MCKDTDIKVKTGDETDMGVESIVIYIFFSFKLKATGFWLKKIAMFKHGYACKSVY